MVMGASLVKHCSRLKKSSWCKMTGAHCAEEMCSHRAKGTRSRIWRRQRVDVEDCDSQATQRQL